MPTGVDCETKSSKANRRVVRHMLYHQNSPAHERMVQLLLRRTSISSMWMYTTHSCSSSSLVASMLDFLTVLFSSSLSCL